MRLFNKRELRRVQQLFGMVLVPAATLALAYRAWEVEHHAAFGVMLMAGTVASLALVIGSWREP
jgi:hypothetical protein